MNKREEEKLKRQQEKLKERLDWMFETMMNDDEKGKSLTSKGNYVDRGLKKLHKIVFKRDIFW